PTDTQSGQDCTTVESKKAIMIAKITKTRVEHEISWSLPSQLPDFSASPRHAIKYGFTLAQYCAALFPRRSLMSNTSPAWPYPKLIAHRGAGRLAPENTLAALRVGAGHGFRMMEYDVKLSRDGIPILVHDDTVDRCSSGKGAAADKTFAELGTLDFGAWHSP